MGAASAWQMHGNAATIRSLLAQESAQAPRPYPRRAMSSARGSTSAVGSTLGRKRGASTLYTHDASTLMATALNVGMPQEESFRGAHKAKVSKLARIVQDWLRDPVPAVVGLNELHPTIANKLMEELPMTIDGLIVSYLGTPRLLGMGVVDALLPVDLGVLSSGILRRLRPNCTNRPWPSNVSWP